MHLKSFSDVLASTQPVLVDFWAPWCQPCLRLSPVVERLARNYSVFKVNVQQDQRLAARYGVNTLPTLIIFRDGEEVGRTVGLRSESELRDVLDSVS